MNSKNLPEDIVAFLLTIYKNIPNKKTRTTFIQKAEKNLNVKHGQLRNRIELELIWEDFRSNGVDFEYDSDNEFEGLRVAKEVNIKPQEAVGAKTEVRRTVAGSSSKNPSNAISKLMQLLQDGETLNVLLTLLKKPEVFYCKYCKSLGLDRSSYLSHNMNSYNGNIICPRWHSYRYALLINSTRRNAVENPAQDQNLHK